MNWERFESAVKAAPVSWAIDWSRDAWRYCDFRRECCSIRVRDDGIRTYSGPKASYHYVKLRLS